MIDYTIVEIENPDDYDKLLDVLPSKFLENRYTKKWVEQLKQCIGTRCKKLLIEYPYYDSEYLSSYYQYYIKKFKNYGKESCRIHLLDEQQYYGYITVRPTAHYMNLSKSYIDPKLILEECAYLLLSDYRVNLYGTNQMVAAFPWMSQQRDFSICAHIAAWSIMKYYGNEHTGYKDINIGEIVDHTSEQANRKLPSKGLNLQQIAEIFKNYQLTPLVIKKELGKEKDFFRELCAYIESGIPVVAAMDKYEHSVAVIGHGKVNLKKLSMTTGIIDNIELLDSLIVNDDNRLPYHKIRYKQKDIKEKYYIDDIDFIIVPLYNRVHLEYAVLYVKVMSYLKTGNLNIDSNSVVRIYLTSANSLKNNAQKDISMNKTLKDIILRLEMPRLVWCVDIASYEEYKKEKISAKMIIDCTSSEGEVTPWLLVHDNQKIKYFSDNQWYKVEEKIMPYGLYKNNLRGMMVCK